jgi:beta-glucosidase
LHIKITESTEGFMNKLVATVVAIVISVPSICDIAAAQSAVTDQTTDHFSPLVTRLLQDLTLDEKITLTTGAKDEIYEGEAGYSEGVARFGIPPMRWSDGYLGVDTMYDATTLPSLSAQASTFDPDLEYKVGVLVGEEARVVNTDVILTPFVNFARLATANLGLGEDPFLSAQLAQKITRGAQSTGVLTMAQQFLANVQNLHQGGGGPAAEGYDFVIDQRTIHEIYLPPFEASVRGGAASILMGYNKLNGDYNSLNQRNLVNLLRNELGWTGWANSDWHANRSVESMNRGLDREMPGVGPMEPEGYPPQYGPKLKAAVEAGQVSMASLNRAVGHQLTQLERFGLLDNTRKPAPEKIDVLKDAAIARAVATEGAVLLKNDGVLPLQQQALDALAFIGPTAAQLATGTGGNRPYGFPDRLISPLTAIQSEVPSAKIAYAVGDPLTGVPIPVDVLKPASGVGQGLARDANDGTKPVVESIDHVQAPLPPGHTYTWRGSISVPQSGAYTFEIATWGGSATMKIDGRQRAISAKLAFAHGTPRRWTTLLPTTDALDHGLSTMQLEAGKSYNVEINAASEADKSMQIRFGWITPEMRAKATEQAVAVAKSAHTVVIFLWNGRGGDQNQGELGFELPDHQNDLVDAVTQANPNTIVVLNASGAVDMPWRGKVRAILEMWLPGQEGGWITADLLTGKANPSGKLALTIPVKLSDTPAMAPDHPERYQGIPDKQEVVFSEGIFVGYRWYDKQNIQPLYPFGFGLSYTSFGYSDLKSTSTADGIDVSFIVKNTGKVAGTEVAQVYLGPPAKEPLPMAVRSLSGFARVNLDAGESRQVEIHIPLRQLCYWSEDKSGWIIAGGKRLLSVGSSSRDLRLNSEVQVDRDGTLVTSPKPGLEALKDSETGRVN